MIDVREYLDLKGRSPYAAWFKRLSPQAATRVAVASIRLAGGNFSNVKGVGGSKKRQQVDIASALASWHDYKRRKQEYSNAPDA